jgi:arylsulfatase A
MNLRLLILVCLLPAVVNSADRPNVVILLSDDLGNKDLGCYGGPVKTPALDGLAARGVKFTDFHAGAAICSPSRATLLTGRQHLRTGIYGVLQDHMHIMHLLEREVTIAEVLRKAGYGTAHFGKWHIGMTSGDRKKPSPTEHGFDYWFGLSNGAHPNHKDPTNFLRNGKPVGPMKGYSCQIVVSDAINWLEAKDDPDQPFFLNIWFNEPHAKIAAPDDIVSIYGDLKDEAAIYSATIDNTDRAIGRLVAKLKAMGKLDNTLIIYSSDHGSYRPDRNGGLNGNKGSNFQGGLRSPGIFFWPDGIRGGRIERTASGAVDLLPTICGLAGIDEPKGVHLDGADLSPLLTEKGTFNRAQPLLWLAPSSGHLATLRDGRYTLMGYRGYDLPFEREKLDAILQRMAELAGIDPSSGNLLARVSNTTFSNPEFRRLTGERVRLQTFQESWIPIIKKGGFSRFALYDLESDPLQKKDISRQEPQVTARLTERLLELYQDVMADAPGLAGYRSAYAPPPTQPAGTKPAQGNTSSAQRASAMPAQGNALGKTTNNGQPQRGGPKFSAAPLGLSKSRDVNPGLRPGLTYGRPVGPAEAEQDRATVSHALPSKDVDLDKLLKQIEATDLPKGYHGSTHQAYVDRRMAELTSQQRQRIGRLWKEKRRLHPKMKNVGGSFVKIMEFVAAGKNAKESNGTKQ